MKSMKVLLIAVLALVACVVVGAVLDGCSQKAANPVAPSQDKSGKTETTIPVDSLVLHLEQRQPTQAATAMSWSEIDMRLWSSALYYIGKNVGIQCKPFVNDRVRGVTGYSLPVTLSDWVHYGSGHVVVVKDGQSAGSGGVQSGLMAGHIIQMHIYYKDKNGNVTDLPHTAFFSEYASGGMYWIDCNFVATNTVGRHFVSWDWFNTRVGSRYCVYQATQ